jgi:hypothetical protein
MLYWAEGSRSRNSIRFTNSDPAMILFFATFLRRCFDVSDERFRITCNLFADHAVRQVEIEQSWLDLLALPRTCLCKSSVNTYSRIVQHIYGAIQEYAGFDREEWLM